MAILFSGRRFHVDFHPIHLREADKQDLTKIEPEFLALIKELDDMILPSTAQSTKKGDHHANENHCSEANNQPDEACDADHDEQVTTWILSPFLQRNIFPTFSPKASNPLLSTLQDMIHRPTLAFTLSINKEVVPVQFHILATILDWY